MGKTTTLLLFLTFVLAGIANAADPNLVAWWKFDETSGNIANDSAGINRGTIYGSPIWITGQIGGALRFDGIDDYIEVPNNSSQQITSNQITLCAWIKLDENVVGTQKRIICKQQTPRIAWGLEIFGKGYDGSVSNQLVFHDSDGGTSTSKCISPTNLVLGQWYHVAVTDDAGTINMYINGLPDYSSVQGYGIPANILAPIMIGKTNPDRAFFIKGCIDDLRIYNKALSADEILDVYQSSLHGIDLAIAKIDTAIAKKEESLSKIKSAIEKETAAFRILDEVLKSRDYGDLKKDDIKKARQKILHAKCFEHISQKMLDKSIDRLEDALESLGVEPEPEPDPNLVAWWKLDEGTGNMAYDSAGTNNGTIVGNPTWTTGQIDGALDFGGDDGVYLNTSAGTGSVLNIYNTNLTISAWVKVRGKGGGTVVARAKGLYITYRLEVNTKVFINTYKQGPGHWLLATNDIIVPDTWYHIVGVFDRTGDKGQVYVNGTLQAEGPMTIDPLSNDAPTKIGCRNDTGDYAFNGVIDDVRIYNKAMSKEKVLQLYQGSL